jgi:hypothetical protein
MVPEATNSAFFFAGHFGGHFFQTIYRGIFSKNIISDLSGGHGLSHALGGLGDRIRPQINSSHLSILPS